METNQTADVILGNEGSAINLELAAEWTGNHRVRHPDNVISHFFGNQILNQVLSQPGCMGLRIYYANSKSVNGWQKFILSIANFLLKVVADCEGERHVIVAGVAKDGTDMLPPPAASAGSKAPQTFASYASPAAGGNTLAEQSVPCPGTKGCPQNALTS